MSDRIAVEPSNGPPVLELRNLSVQLAGPRGSVTVVDSVSLAVSRGEVLGVVGESGSGKSLTALSILGLLDPPGRISGGEVRFHGEDLARASERRLRALRGFRIAMVFQDPMATLNPVLSIESQMVETVRAHRPVSRAEAGRIALDALTEVGIPDPALKLRAYPHQLSGGMRQRVAIAIALLHRPDLLIADEPTTALDVTLQALILSRIQELVGTRGLSAIWITHDLAVAAGLADRLCVFYAGQVVESGPTAVVIGHPRHPYTKGLIEARPGGGRRGEPLRQIPGTMPTPMALPGGCSFRPRCERASEACLTMPELTGSGGHVWRCVHPLTAESP